MPSKCLDENLSGKTPIAENFSVTESLFLQKCARFVYLSDVNNAREELQRQGFSNASYVSCDSRVLSELAATIYADGRAVGVINIESDIVDAYRPGHLEVLKTGATQIGAIFAEARRRGLSSRGLSKYYDRKLEIERALAKIHELKSIEVTSSKNVSFEDEKNAVLSRLNISKLSDIINTSRELKSAGIRFILYRADYFRGELVAQWDRRFPDMMQGPEFSYSFTDSSLAAECARRQERVPTNDICDSLRTGTPPIAVRGVDAFKIKGPCCAMPINCAGEVAAVLVVWSVNGEGRFPDKNQILFNWLTERINRIIHLLANDPVSLSDTGLHYQGRVSLSANSFLKLIDRKLFPYDKSQNWDIDRMANDSQFRMNIFGAVLEALVDDCVGIGRVRLWVRVRSKKGEFTFKCIAFRNAPGYDSAANIDYSSLESTDADPYCAYTVTRWPADPYARQQHRSMFKNACPDTNSVPLQKDPDGPWIVAPIGKGQSKDDIVGFISADCHRIVDGVPRAREVSETESAYHRLALDLVSHIIGGAVRLECRDLSTACEISNGKPGDAGGCKVGKM